MKGYLAYLTIVLGNYLIKSIRFAGSQVEDHNAYFEKSDVVKRKLYSDAVVKTGKMRTQVQGWIPTVKSRVFSSPRSRVRRHPNSCTVL